MTISSRICRFRAVGIAACVLVLSACDKKPLPSPEPTAGRYRIVSIDGLIPGTREAITIDTATGATWRLVKSDAPGSHDDIGWHPVADLTIESRTPYYRHRAIKGQPAVEARP